MSVLKKLTEVPTCNQELINAALNQSNGLRVDGRRKDDYRPLEIVFGKKMGSVLVSLGNTRVLTTITAELSEPRGSRPSEGNLRISVDLSPMASPNWDGGRLTHETVEISRLLERSIRDAKCLDLESLCLVVGKKAWNLESNIIVFNTEGNLVEAASISLIAGLCHFKRPDVTVTENGEVIVHDFDDKHPIPLTVFHHPFCTKFCFFSGTKHVVVDPIEVEEEICDGYIIVGGNAHRELTAIHVSAESKIDKDVVLKCCHRSLERTKRLTEVLKRALEEDKKSREDNDTSKFGFGQYLRNHGPALLGCTQTVEKVEYEEDEELEEQMEVEVVENTKAFRFMEHQQQPYDSENIGQGGHSQWDFEETDTRPKSHDGKKSKTEPIDVSDDSDEEVVMESNEFQRK